jgi:tetratricopeptide (TPR) repeat protein
VNTCRIVLACALLVAGVESSAAQVALRGEPPRRLRLDATADTNDWQHYFDYGAAVIQAFPNRADTAFYWAARLDPSRAEPLFARWVTFWLTDVMRFMDYMENNTRVRESPAVRRLDTLYLHALERNPFVPQTLLVLPYDKLPGEWREDPRTLGWLAYSRLDYVTAADYFGRLVSENPDKYAWVRYDRALALVPQGLYDSARVEIVALLTTLRRGERGPHLSPVYQSKELMEYGVGLLELVQGNLEAARAAFGRALVENLAFFPAHAMLGDLALARHDTAAAAQEYAQAAELAPAEPWILYRDGVALTGVRRYRDAVAPLERAIALEPLYAQPYLALGYALEAAGDRAGAVRAFQQYLQRAPRREADKIAAAQRRVTDLATGH